MATALCIALPAAGRAARAQAPVLLANVTLIDGRGGPPAPNRSVLVRDGRIAAIGPASASTWPPEVRVEDLSGRFLLPGLIDTHVHLPPNRTQAEARLAFMFRAGITSARDMGGDAVVFREAAKAAKSPEVPMAQLYYVAFWAGLSFYQEDKRPFGSTEGEVPGTVPWFQAVTLENNLDSAAIQGARLGVHALNLYSDMSLGTLRGAAAAGHRENLLVASGAAVFPNRPSAVIAAGVDNISHAALLVWEAADSMPLRFHTSGATNFGPMGPYSTVSPEDPRIVRVLTEMHRRGTVLDATVSAIAKGISPAASDWTLRVTALAKQRGVAISTGTDHPQDPAVDRYPALFREIELLVSGAELTPLQAITAATRNGARAIGIEAERGTIEPGKIADMIVLDADPLRDIENLHRVAAVIKGGWVHPIVSPSP
ncbi:MAG: amidohydrolase family protein [Gemmatimonadota bacterium]